ncbi:alpha/beta-type small acid-soluble spore protein [Thermoactinomyces mirandus]|uniref:Alpha/beta-type small acid-soluble spore protein n=1 Tax=Thermoactinomyces mirandus TaxID=2756294 RepID=A0A7W1XUH0_9BACL|nr:alpha/beta-type small acid-soluble spore protein [Thermoactinomyces mirandus]MBA4603524.1 alpha/beta-type small acid-soluble spore protein [Thermoactinomyces mirandus]
MARKNRLVVPGAKDSLEQMKQEIAQEFGVELGADSTARANGSVGGEMTKRLVALGSQMMEQSANRKAGE